MMTAIEASLWLYFRQTFESTVEEVPTVSAMWPSLTLSEWEATRDTLHMWTQVVGKVRLALAPMLNHWWQVPLYVTARGLTTSLMHTNRGGLELEFDFVDHVLALRASDGRTGSVALEPRSVASFYAATMSALADLDVRVDMLARPVEVPDAIPFAEDTQHASYDADAAQRFWLALVEIERVYTVFRARFIGKVSPVHFFWGGFDLTVTRFSGRPAPKHPGGVPNCPDWVQEMAYSHEVSSCGFWPGGSAEGSFFGYAYPEPDGFRDQLGEFVLPYEAVRTAGDPDATLLTFLQTTYEAVAVPARWDRPALEVAGRPGGMA